MNELDFGRRASEFRHRGFWATFRERHPAEEPRRVRNGPWFWQRWLPDQTLVVSMYIAPERNLVGVFFGQNARLGAIGVTARLKPYQDAIEGELGGLRDEQRWSPGSLGSVWRVNVYAADNWPAMSDWMVCEADRFERAAVKVLSET